MASSWKEHFERAIDKLGSQPKLAEALRCSQSKISWLLVTAKEISAEDALAIHRATGGEVSAAQLRPDIWEQDGDLLVSRAVAPVSEAAAEVHS